MLLHINTLNKHDKISPTHRKVAAMVRLLKTWRIYSKVFF